MRPNRSNVFIRVFQYREVFDKAIELYALVYYGSKSQGKLWKQFIA